MTLKSEAIKAYLNVKTHPDLATLYHKGMEVQVNVGQGKGARIDAGSAQGKSSTAFSDGVETWRAFRIPSKAMSEPVDNDGAINWNFDEHVEGIGMTGWDWQKKQSIWVAYDFDAMLGHSEKHSRKLSEAEMQGVHDTVTKLPFVTLRRSTSGRGLHLYVFLEPIETLNHTEHAALARAILSYMSGLTGVNFSDKVDVCGSNMWVWHKKMYNQDGTRNAGLSLIRQGEVFKASKVPTNWRDHLTVVTRKSTRTVPRIEGVPTGAFEELSGQRAKVLLDEEHKAFVNWLNEKGYPGSWDSDNHMLITHTHYLKLAKEYLILPGNQKVRGEFETNSTGRNEGHDINCFMFPTKGGSWAVRRYGHGVQEHKIWIQDGKGWTRTYFNRELTLMDVARLFDGIETEQGGYQFPSVAVGKDALKKLGIIFDTAGWIDTRIMKVKEHKGDYKVVVTIPYTQGDKANEMPGWIPERGQYRRIFSNPRSGVQDEAASLGDYDDMVRHIISENGEDLGWVVSTEDGTWRHEPVNHVKLFLVSKGIGKKDLEIILGQAISQAWVIVNKPFEPEYPGDRQWNRSSARFKVVPTLDGETLSFPTWMKVFDHCGRSLDRDIQNHQWCKDNGITTGGEYLKLWFASLIRYPRQPLPYLAFFGPQDSGKSTIHEAFCQLILDGGYMDGAIALNSQSNFNGELQDSILCTLEETDLRNKIVYQKVKDWVTSALISIHIKGQTPYKAPNFTHWIQCVNDRDFIPVFSGDSRIVISFVESIPDDQKIPKRDLWTLLTKEAPDFLAALLATEIPDSKDRLMVPVVRTADKVAAEFSSMDAVQQFVNQFCFRIPGTTVSQDALHKAFIEWIGLEEAHNWGKIKFGKSMPQDIPKGRISLTGTQLIYYGNLTLDKEALTTPRWISCGTFMQREGNAKSTSS